jgi:hypothetical protein
MNTKPLFLLFLAPALAPLAISACSFDVRPDASSGTGGTTVSASSSESANSSVSSNSATSSSTGGAGGASASSGMGGAGGGSASSGMGGAGGSSTSTGSSSSGGPPCGDPACASGQLCVVPVCRDVLGEECYYAEPGTEEVCPPGTKRAPQFDPVCPSVPTGSTFACVGGCPAPAPFCLDVPSACVDMPTCVCLGSNPCEPSNSGSCKDSNINGGVLTCSLQP